ncbi:MAG: glutamine-hydrolyzing carbamoyl-phosphate synthase small subunit [Candidatus Thermoplasmatota archaeon]|nr:glutamine-hydrolyzing carbamoyl-phosphate synthase small subunit [Candidatus Thermoplasmatota archaeon]MCL5791116.1 glutamine-hydrolyzing carbamoyl-phosphate synthase small subunit [Candidatus Thermoplasmatota archaeon]
MRRYLLLEDGDSFEGKAFGASVEKHGDLIFTTSATGYYEAMTDPSYAGQIMVFSFPSIFYYEFWKDKPQSDGIKAEGIIVKDTMFPQGRGFASIDGLMRHQGVPGIYGIDTRRLVKKIRDSGNIRGIITDDPENHSSFKDHPTRNLIREVTKRSEIILNKGMDRKILFVDLGSKIDLLEKVSSMGETHVINLDSRVRSLSDYDLIFISNGPGDPSDASLSSIYNMIKKAEGNIPVAGVCMGNQVIAGALGASIERMTFGHHGINHAVSDRRNIFITSHNHNFRVSEESLRNTGLKPVQWDLNDGTVEMIENMEKSILSIQYHPEGSPGPVDPSGFFRKVEEMFNAIRN